MTILIGNVYFERSDNMSSKYIGICLLGARISRLIDQGEKEEVNTILDLAKDKKLVKHLTHKYEIDFPSSSYDTVWFEDFFYNNLLTSQQGGIYNNGLLLIVSTILSTAECTTPNWDF